MNIDQTFLDRYENYGIESHNDAEIKKLTLLRFEDNKKRIHRNDKLVLVLVSPELLTRTIYTRLERMKNDLHLDGYRSRFIKTDLYRGARHQDGRTVLAIRDLFRDVHDNHRKFSGAILIGDFPEALLVRRCIWRQEPRKQKEYLRINNRPYKGVYIMIDPEVFADRSDIVLSDLNGNWKNIYQQGRTSLDCIYAISKNKNWKLTDTNFKSVSYSFTRKYFQDFFWINDSNYVITSRTGAKLEMTYNSNLRNPEVSIPDKRQPNPIAMPDIFVSRINPSNIAFNPNPGFRDKNDKKFLAIDGKPQSVTLKTAVGEQQVGDLKHHSPTLTRRLLAEYLDRNHAWRNNKIKVNNQCASIAYDENEKFNADTFARELGCSRLGDYSNTTFNNASLIDYVKFLKRCSMVKCILAHSGHLSTQFGKDYAIDDLERIVGRRPWMWYQTRRLKYTPSFIDLKGRANVYLHRTIYANKILKDSNSCFYLHAGCNVNSAHKSDSSSYIDDDYGWFQNADGILFYLKGLAVLSRAKTFNDWPKAFIKAFMRSRYSTVGNGYYALFKEDSLNDRLISQENKRSYTWGISGDWTLKHSHGKVPVIQRYDDTHESGFYSSE